MARTSTAMMSSVVSMSPMSFDLWKMRIFVCETIYLNDPFGYANSDLNDENHRKYAPFDCCYCYCLWFDDEMVSAGETHWWLVDVRDSVPRDGGLVFDLFAAHTCDDDNTFAMMADGTATTLWMMRRRTIISAATEIEKMKRKKNRNVGFKSSNRFRSSQAIDQLIVSHKIHSLPYLHAALFRSSQ